MTREETFEQFVTKKYALYDNPRGNHHPLEHEDLTNSVIDCFPLEFESSKTALSTQVIGMSKTQLIKHLRMQAYALKFDDFSPRPVPRAAPATPRVPPRPLSAARDNIKASVRCWECGEREDTPSGTAENGLRRALPATQVDLQLERQQRALLPHVRSLNLVQQGMVVTHIVSVALIYTNSWRGRD
jgi:hypothetical protein